jgi:two-component system sensor histidine kinase/response regulator
MPNKEISSILSDWTDEFVTTLIRSKSLCVALFTTNGDLIFANDSMSVLFKAEPFKSFINPTFDNLVLSDNSAPLVFEGFLTLGDYSSINTSIWSQVYRKENKLLVLGGVNAATLIEQNETMHQLNHGINNLQRELIKEKHSLEKTLIQLNEANAQLKKLNIDKDRFISILGHDLKSPFNNILGSSEVLTSEINSLNSDEIKEIAGNINKSAKITNKLLEDILMWARTQQGSITFKPQNLSLSATCGNIIEILTPGANAKNIIINYSATDHLIVFADADMLKTVMRNLVSNAIKFTNNGGTISITARQIDSNITISVSDNGIGIAPDNLSKLFNISEVITTTGTAKETGTGLGLLLCKEFVEKHGVKIWVESEQGKGSEFKFTLPVAVNLQPEIN